MDFISYRACLGIVWNVIFDLFQWIYLNVQRHYIAIFCHVVKSGFSIVYPTCEKSKRLYWERSCWYLLALEGVYITNCLLTQLSSRADSRWQCVDMGESLAYDVRCLVGLPGFLLWAWRIVSPGSTVRPGWAACCRSPGRFSRKAIGSPPFCLIRCRYWECAPPHQPSNVPVILGICLLFFIFLSVYIF